MKTYLNPYPGLRPFSSKESHLFFGREKHISDIIHKLEKHRFISVVGNSGSGKSSLLRAGVIPSLEKSRNEKWDICIFKPGNNAIGSLTKAIKKHFSGSIVDEEEISQHILNSDLGLVQSLRYAISEGKKLLIIVDQFEELFNEAHDNSDENPFGKKESFVNNLLQVVAQNDLPVYIMITLRSDFLGECEKFLGLAEAINDSLFLIPRMNREEILSIIKGPAEFAGCKISPRLQQHLLSDLSNDHDQLPVLQHALMRTFSVWNKKNEWDKPIDFTHYEETGMMNKALSNHAEETLNELDEDKQLTASKLFKALTTKTEDNRGIRRPTKIRNIASIIDCSEEDIITVSEVFRAEGCGLIMPSSGIAINSESFLDISHESLMRVWVRLKEWADEEFEDHILYKRITESALLYQKGQAGLWRDPDLIFATDWLSKQKNSHWANQYNPHFELSKKFIETSNQEKQFDIAKKRRTTLLMRSLAASAIVFLSILALWALRERHNATLNEEHALQQEHVAEEQQKLAYEQKKIAEEQRKIAVETLKAVETQKHETEKQKSVAIENAQIAHKQKVIAEQSSQVALNEKYRAESEKKSAIFQRKISDSLKIVAEHSEKTANRLHMLSVAQNLSIRSQLLSDGINDDLKALLAMKAYQIKSANGAQGEDVEVTNALFGAEQAFRKKSGSHSVHCESEVRAIALNHKSTLVALGDNNGQISILHSDDFSKMEMKLARQNFIPKFLAFSNDENKLYCASDVKKIMAFTLHSENSVPVFVSVLPSDISGLVEDNNKLLVTTLDGYFYMLDARKGEVIFKILLPSTPHCLLHKIGSDKVVIGSEKGKIYFVDLKNKIVTDSIHFPAERITALDYNTNNALLICGDETGEIYIRHLKSETTQVQKIHAHSAPVTSILYSSKYAKVISSSYDGKIEVRDLNHINAKTLLIKEHDSWIYNLVLDESGENIFSAGKDKTVKAFCITDKALLEKLKTRVTRKLTEKEWEEYVGTDVPYSP